MSYAKPHRRRSWFDSLINLFAVIAGATMCALTVLICLDVAVRHLRLFAMPWSLELAEYSLLVITFLGTPWVLATGGQVSIDIVIDRLAPPARRRMRAVSYVIGAVVCIVLFGYSVGAWWQSFSQGTLVVETFTFPEWYFFAVPPPVFLMLAAIFLRWLLHPPEGGGLGQGPEGF